MFFGPVITGHPQTIEKLSALEDLAPKFEPHT